MVCKVLLLVRVNLFFFCCFRFSGFPIPAFFITLCIVLFEYGNLNFIFNRCALKCVQSLNSIIFFLLYINKSIDKKKNKNYILEKFKMGR